MELQQHVMTKEGECISDQWAKKKSIHCSTFYDSVWWIICGLLSLTALFLSSNSVFESQNEARPGDYLWGFFFFVVVPNSYPIFFPIFTLVFLIFSYFPQLIKHNNIKSEKWRTHNFLANFTFLYKWKFHNLQHWHMQLA